MDDALARALATWNDLDAAHAIHPRDRAAIAATESARALVLDRWVHGLHPDRASRRRDPNGSGEDRDLFSACALLGRLLFDAGASPTLAASAIDGAAAALAAAGVPHDAAALPIARSSLAEGYAAAVAEHERALARRAWRYPACVVRIDAETAAVTGGFDDDDRDATAEWAAGVARGLSKAGIRRVRTNIDPGSARARELDDALDLVGITIVRDEPEGAARKTSWLRLPWQKK